VTRPGFSYYLPEAVLLFGLIMEILHWAKNGVYAFGYNSAKSEQVWMKSGALWAHCWYILIYWRKADWIGNWKYK